MRILVAPDSFKDAMRASAACEHIAVGIRRVMPEAEIDLCPIADGGEGFTEAITFGCPRAIAHRSRTVDPLGKKMYADWVMLHDAQGQPDTAVIELAAASGLELLKPKQRDPTRTHTYGTGMLIREALRKGARRIVLGIGGSATNDAGMGIAFANGVLFYDNKGGLFNKTGMPGRLLQKVARIDPIHPDLPRARQLRVACDVTNPLTGPDGAAHVYAPQKGATPEQVEQLDAGLRHMAELWRKQLGVDVEQMPGAGAAGGVGGGMVAMLGAELVPGAELVLDTVGFDERVRRADLVITGEGRLDGQSLQGKAVMAVAKRCQTAGVPCVALVGSVGEGAERCKEHGLTDYRVLGPDLKAEESIRRTGELLEQRAADLIRSWTS